MFPGNHWSQQLKNSQHDSSGNYLHSDLKWRHRTTSSRLQKGLVPPAERNILVPTAIFFLEYPGNHCDCERQPQNLPACIPRQSYTVEMTPLSNSCWQQSAQLRIFRWNSGHHFPIVARPISKGFTVWETAIHGLRFFFKVIRYFCAWDCKLGLRGTYRRNRVTVLVIFSYRFLSSGLMDDSLSGIRVVAFRTVPPIAGLSFCVARST